MKIIIANPNSSTQCTDAIMASAAGSNTAPDTELIALTNPKGTPAIDCTFSDYQSAWSLHRAVLDAVEEHRPDAVVIAGFGNLGVFGLKEALSIPTLGMSETAMAVASTLGHRFTVLTTLLQYVPAMEDLVTLYGMQTKCASVRAIDLCVTDCVGQREQTLDLLEQEAMNILEQDGAEVIILGSGGLSGYSEDLEKRIGMTVLDPVRVTVKFAEMLVEAGISHSKKRKFAAPPQPLDQYMD